jgi:hypothetical protein
MEGKERNLTEEAVLAAVVEMAERQGLGGKFGRKTSLPVQSH